MEHYELLQMMSLPLEQKIIKTKQRIKEFYEKFDGKVYISFSGGKDSTVLLRIARELYPDIVAVFLATGLEYPEIMAFVKTIDNVVTLHPKMGFQEVISHYGYPVISKEQAQHISEVRNCKDKSGINYQNRMNGNKWGRGKVSEKWKFLLDAPFKISHQCCNIMKKNPAKKYEKETGNHPITGIMAIESSMRTINYLKTGCNSFNGKRPMSQPLGFWTEQDVFEYITTFNVPFADVYGNIVKVDGKFETTGVDRTGCVFCLFGITQGVGENRIQRLGRTHPKLYKFCLENLGIKEVLGYINVPYDIVSTSTDVTK